MKDCACIVCRHATSSSTCQHLSQPKLARVNRRGQKNERISTKSDISSGNAPKTPTSAASATPHTQREAVVLWDNSARMKKDTAATTRQQEEEQEMQASHIESHLKSLHCCLFW